MSGRTEPVGCKVSSFGDIQRAGKTNAPCRRPSTLGFCGSGRLPPILFVLVLCRRIEVSSGTDLFWPILYLFDRDRPS